jgi:PIF1-like helicase
LADFEAFARRRPRDDLADLAPGGLGSRALDQAYNWTSHVGRYNSLYKEVWDQIKAENPVSQVVTIDSSPDLLNLEQRRLYNVVVKHYSQGLATGCPPPQLLLNVNGVAGSGKTFTLLKICARLQELALQAGEQNPVFRAAPTGITAFNILGKTLHGFLRLPVKGVALDLLVATLQALQYLFQGCRYLIINEKSMV